jgi:hypothetical protein
MERCDICTLPAKTLRRLTYNGTDYKVCTTCCCDFRETMAFLEHGQRALARDRKSPANANRNRVPSGE